MKIKGSTSFLLCIFLVLNVLANALSETASEDKDVWTVEVEHLLETFSGDYEPAEETEEEPNPEYRSSIGFSDSVSELKRSYPGFTIDRVETKTDADGKIVKASVLYKRNTYRLQIDYVLEGQIIMTYTADVEYEAGYSVPAPVIGLYTADQTIISGIMGAEDQFFTIKYTRFEDDKPDEPIEPSTPGEPATPDEPIDPSTPGEPATPDEPIDPSTPGEPATPGEPTDPSTPGEPATPGEPIDPSTPGEPATPDEPTDLSTPGEPATPGEPMDPSTPSEPATPSEPSTPSEPGGKPGGGRPGGSRPGGGNGQSVSTISPGEAATSYHAMGQRDLSAHWQGTVEAEGARVSQINLDGGSAVIAFSGGEGVFTVGQESDGAYTLSALSAGTFEVNGFALKILKESGYDTLVLELNDTQIMIDTSRACASDEYAHLKAGGVGERRITYSYCLTDEGDAAFHLYADGGIVSDEGIYTVLRKEDDGW